MSVSVYLSNQQIQVAVGSRGKKATLNNIYTGFAPEGSIINGMIMNEGVFIEFLKKFWAENRIPQKDVYLVVNSNKIAGKSIEIPQMKKSKVGGFILREFADMQREEEENTIAYTKLGINKTTKVERIYAEMAEKEQLKDYLNLFNSIGVELKGILSSEGNILGYAQMKLAKQYKTFVLQIANGNLVSNILFVDGEYKYYNSVRCFHEMGTMEYHQDCVHSLGQLTQFMSAARINANIEHIILAGMENQDVRFYEELVRNEGLDIPCEIINTGISSNASDNFRAQQVLFAVSGLYDFGKESNFLTLFNAKEDESEKDPSFRKNVISIIVVLAVMIFLFGISLTLRLVRQGTYNDLVSVNESGEHQQVEEDYQSAVDKKEALQYKYNSINGFVESIDTYPICTDDVIEILENTAEGYAEIEILSFNTEDGIVTFSAKSEDVNNIYKYIDRLFDEDIFRSVDHTGYTVDEDTSLYDIHVICTLKEGVGREEN